MATKIKAEPQQYIRLNNRIFVQRLDDPEMFAVPGGFFIARKALLDHAERVGVTPKCYAA